ncbi:hypothetical protein KCU78_g164, partial [Aureobasidium melanogenum]
MRVYAGMAVASMVAAAAALSSNGTTQTVTVTRTSWSTILSCPSPTTVTVCNAQCPTSSGYFNNANIVYQTISDCQAGDVINIAETLTTLAKPTILTLEETISNLVLVPDTATGIDLTAAATVTTVVYQSSMTGNSGQVITCQTGVTTLGHDGVVLTNCPCTVQSTVLEITATGSGAMPTAMVSSSNYIVKIIYVYVVETIIEQVPTTITTTATNILTTNSAEAAASASSALPTIVTVDRVTFLLQYNSTYDGVADAGLRKRQAFDSPSIPGALNDCLTRCSAQADCRAASFTVCTGRIELINERRIVIKLSIVNRPQIFINKPQIFVNGSQVFINGPQVFINGPQVFINGPQVFINGPQVFVELHNLLKPGGESDPQHAGPILVSSSQISPTSRSSNQISSSSAKYPMSNTSISSTSLSSRSSSSSRLPVPITNSSVISISSASSLIASEILGYPPAVSYCSSAYPVTTYTSLFNATITDTVTDTGVASTYYGNITLPAETTVQTIGETVTQTSFFPVEATETDTTTTTVTIPNLPAPFLRRQISAASAASIFTSILSRPASDIGLVCSCLQTPVTDSVTSTVTVLSTTTSTPIVSANITLTPPVMTLQTTETNTETIDVTTITATKTSTEVVTATASGCSVSPAAAVRESVVTLTSTYANTYIDILTTTIASTQTVTTCTPSAFTIGQCQAGVYTYGTRYYNQFCGGSSLAGGATVLVLPAAQFGLCNQYCSVYSALCSGINYNTAARLCTFLSGSALSPSPAVAYQAALAYTTNPCVATSTDIEIQYSTQISSSVTTSVYESTVTLSASGTSCAPDPVPT